MLQGAETMTLLRVGLLIFARPRLEGAAATGLWGFSVGGRGGFCCRRRKQRTYLEVISQLEV